MTEISVQCRIRNHDVSVAELNAIEYERTKHVLHEMKFLGANVSDGDRELTHSEIDLLSVNAAHRLNIEVRSQYSSSEIQNLYTDGINKMETLWKSIGNHFDLHKDPVKLSQTYMKITGVNPDLIINGKPSTTTKNENPDMKMKRIAAEASEMALAMNPEHFFVTAGEQGLYGMETFGMYGDPYPQLIHSLSLDALPLQRDPDYPVASTGQPSLLDGTPLYTLPFHQYKPLEDGIEMKLGVIMPATTPDEIVLGHEYHLAIEFLHTAEMYAQE